VLSSAELLLDLIDRQHRAGRVVAGWEQIVSLLQRELDAATARGRSSYLLWGTYHDSAAQVEAFRRLVGPMGLSGLNAIAVEPFYADGRWADVPIELQHADSQAMARYLRSGAREAWQSLLSSQERENRTAWKYRYLPTVMDLLLDARATGQRLLPCDLAPALQPAFGRESEQGELLLLRVRELHCLLALEDALRTSAPPHRLALLWGQAHVAAEGFARFLPEQAQVIALYVFGHRPGSHGVEIELGERLRTTDPLLIPLDEQQRELALLLPGPRLAATLDRALDRRDQPLSPEQRGGLEVTSSRPGALHIDGKTHAVETELVLRLEPGAHAYLFTSDDTTLAGVVDMPPQGAVALDLQPEQRAVRLETYVHER